MLKGLRQKFRRSLEYRRAFADANASIRISMQLRAMRIKRGLSQAELATAMGTSQSRISAIESCEYNIYSFSVLKRMATFFDVALYAEFVSFDDLVTRIEQQTPDNLAPCEAPAESKED